MDSSIKVIQNGNHTHHYNVPGHSHNEKLEVPKSLNRKHQANSFSLQPHKAVTEGSTQHVLLDPKN